MIDREMMECSQCLCLASRRAARAITRTFDGHLRQHGIRATQFSLLAQLELRGRLSIGELADAVGADRTTLTRNLAPLEEQSLIRIGLSDDDARSRIVTLLPKGRNILTRSFPAWRKAQAAVTASIGAGLADNLRRLAGLAQI
jgi:DNA-binding MarR family transcriptional regulator